MHEAARDGLKKQNKYCLYKSCSYICEHTIQLIWKKKIKKAIQHSMNR